MMKLPSTILVVLMLFAGGECVTKAAQSAQRKNGSGEIRMREIVTNDVKLSYRRYSMLKRHHKVRIDEAVEGGQAYFADVDSAVLTRHRRTLIRFDGNYTATGNVVAFGLFSFLGHGRKQFFVSQDTFRGGNQWVVSLRRSPRVIYDGHSWRTGREIDDMSLVDLDGDGVYEVVVPTCIFYGFEHLCPACTPLPTIIFKYSKKAGRYLPANRQFADYLLARVEDQKRHIQSTGDPVNNMNHLGNVLGVVLDYVFAGREAVAWTFFDQAYKLADKDKIKKEIRAELKDSPVYRFIYRKHTRRRRNLRCPS